MISRSAEDPARTGVLNSRTIVPESLEQDSSILRVSLLDNRCCKSILKALKVSGISNAKLGTKKSVIAHKMVQKMFSVETTLVLVDGLEHADGILRSIASNLVAIPSTVVKVKDVGGIEEISWVRVDILNFENGEVVMGQPILTAENNRTVQQQAGREHEFLAVAYCRLFHVLSDTRMTKAHAVLIEPRTRAELLSELVDAWTEHIVPLFNYESFNTVLVPILAGGVTLSDIATFTTCICGLIIGKREY